jgi:hypothetical protein
MHRGEAREGGVYGDTRGNNSAAQNFEAEHISPLTSLHISPPPSKIPVHHHLEPLTLAIRLSPGCNLYIYSLPIRLRHELTSLTSRDRMQRLGERGNRSREAACFG